MASYRVGLPLTSPPPVRAATSMFLISLANILPRLASMTAFLCLVVAHLEWPLMLHPHPSRPSGHRWPPEPCPRNSRAPRRRRSVPDGTTSQAGAAAESQQFYPPPLPTPPGRAPAHPGRRPRPTALG